MFKNERFKRPVCAVFKLTVPFVFVAVIKIHPSDTYRPQVVQSG